MFKHSGEEVFDRPKVEPCADVIVSAAARRSILVGGGGAALGAKNSFQRFPKRFPFILKIF